MKKLLVTILMLSTMSANAMSPGSLRTEVICEEGYKFLIVYSSQKGTGPSVVQMMRRDKDFSRPPQPLLCGNKKVK